MNALFRCNLFNYVEWELMVDTMHILFRCKLFNYMQNGICLLIQCMHCLDETCLNICKMGFVC